MKVEYLGLTDSEKTKVEMPVNVAASTNFLRNRFSFRLNAEL